jgi:hypothetical protein
MGAPFALPGARVTSLGEGHVRVIIASSQWLSGSVLGGDPRRVEEGKERQAGGEVKDRGGPEGQLESATDLEETTQ